MSEKYSPEEIARAHKILYNEGIKMRYQVAGKEYVDKALANADNPFSRAMQEYVSESCWGSIWTRPGLDLKVRSFLNIVMLCCQNRSQELATHVKGAMNNGATEEEVREVVLQAACYCGMPAGMEGFRVAWKAIEEWREAQGKGKKAGNTSHHAGGEEHRDVGLEERVKPEDE